MINLDIFGPNSSFGKGVDISPDGKFVIVGAPTADNPQTEYKGVFNPIQITMLEIFNQYKQQLWRAVTQIEGAVAQDLFSHLIQVYFIKKM